MARGKTIASDTTSTILDQTWVAYELALIRRTSGLNIKFVIGSDQPFTLEKSDSNVMWCKLLPD